MLFRKLTWPRALLLLAIVPVAAPVADAADLDQTINAEMVWNASVRANNLPDGPAGSAQSFSLPDSQLTAAEGGTRVLGLTKFRGEFDWRRHKESGIYFVLRPDALLARGGSTGVAGIGTEFDSRVGSSYRALAPISLLDSYFIRASLGDQFSGKVGVWESMAPMRSAYPVTADFSLRVRLPEKYYGLQLDGGKAKAEVPPVGATADYYAGKIAWRLIGFSQDGDRGEDYMHTKRDADAAPGVDSQNIGTAAGVDWHFSESIDLEFLGGVQHHVRLEGKVREIFLNLVATKKFLFLGNTSLIVADVRQSQENWMDIQTDSLQQFSGSLSGSYLIATSTRAVTGVQYGSSERFIGDSRAAMNLYRGYQIDLGLRAELREGLDWGLLYVHESRSRKTEIGVSSVDELDHTPGVTRRLSVSLNYLVGTGS